MEWLLSPWVVIGVVVGVLAGLSVRAKYMAGDFGTWREIAATLPWRDRCRLYVATSRGRAVSPPSLALLAVRRGELVAASTEVALARPGRRRLFIGAVLFWVAIGMIEVLAREWLLVAWSAGILLATVFAPYWERRGLELTRRSVEVNRRLAEDLTGAGVAGHQAG